MAHRSTSGATYAPYRLSHLIQGGEESFESRVSDLIAQRNDAASRIRGSYYLPSAAFTRDLVAGTPSAGGNSVGAGMEAVAAAARPALLLERMGAVRVEVSAVGPVSLPVWQPDAGSAWLSEGSSAPSLTSTVKEVTVTGRMAASRLMMSRRMQAMATDIEAAVLAEVAASVAGTIEKGFIAGSGSSNEPLGLLNTPDRQTKSFTATSPSYSEVVDMLELYALADGDLSRAAWMMHPTMASSLLKTELSSGSGQFLAVVSGANRQPLLAGVPAFVSRHVPAGKLILLDPSVVRTVFWGAPQLVADSYSGGKSIRGDLELVLMNMVDIAVLHPAHVVVGSN